MTPEEQAVEDAKVAAAAAAANEPTEIEKQLAEKDALILKITTDRDNYKKGMLKAKGKIEKEEPLEEEDIDEKINRLVNEKLLDTQLNAALKARDDLMKEVLKRNKELETALKNRTGINTADSGTSSDTKLTPKDGILSDEKLKQLKAMGWDDKKIEMFKKNLIRLK